MSHGDPALNGVKESISTLYPDAVSGERETSNPPSAPDSKVGEMAAPMHFVSDYAFDETTTLTWCVKDAIGDLKNGLWNLVTTEREKRVDEIEDLIAPNGGNIASSTVGNVAYFGEALFITPFIFAGTAAGEGAAKWHVGKGVESTEGALQFASGVVNGAFLCLGGASVARAATMVRVTPVVANAEVAGIAGTGVPALTATGSVTGGATAAVELAPAAAHGGELLSLLSVESGNAPAVVGPLSRVGISAETALAGSGPLPFPGMGGGSAAGGGAGGGFFNMVPQWGSVRIYPFQPNPSFELSPIIVKATVPSPGAPIGADILMSAQKPSGDTEDD